VAEEIKKEHRLVSEDDPLVRHGKGIGNTNPVYESGITENDLDDDPEKAVKEMEDMESSMIDVEKDINEKTKRVEESAKALDEPELEESSKNESPPSQTGSIQRVPENVNELTAVKNMDDKTKKEMQNILGELRDKMSEIDRLTNELKQQKKELSKLQPKDTEKLLEEIDVPPLEMLK
jgi:hypothetical protein